MLQPDKRTSQPSPVAAVPFIEPRPHFVRDAGNDDIPHGIESSGPISYTCTRIVPMELERLRERSVLHDSPGEPGTEAFRMLRTQVLFWLAEREGSTLAITSPDAGDGKTSTAINLALHIANEVDYTVLLVDANLRAPSIQQVLGLQGARGLSDHLLEGARLPDLLVNPGIGRLVVLPAGRAQPNSAELLGSRAMGRLVMELKARYPRRIILFDLPSVLESSDVLSFSRHVDGILMVVQEGRSARSSLSRAEAILPQDKLAGVAMTRVRVRRSRPLRPRRAGWLRRLFER
jgi:protein-tyrosine kinase